MEYHISSFFAANIPIRARFQTAQVPCVRVSGPAGFGDFQISDRGIFLAWTSLAGRKAWYAAGQASRQLLRSGASRMELIMRNWNSKNPSSLKSFTCSMDMPCAWQAELLRFVLAPVKPPKYGASRMKRTVLTDACDWGGDTAAVARLCSLNAHS